jgi:hypothetical protein
MRFPHRLTVGQFPIRRSQERRTRTSATPARQREKLFGRTSGCSTLAPHEPDPAAAALPGSHAVVAADGHSPVGEVVELRWGSWAKGGVGGGAVKGVGGPLARSRLGASPPRTRWRWGRRDPWKRPCVEGGTRVCEWGELLLRSNTEIGYRLNFACTEFA